MELRQLIYVSTACRLLDEAELLAILEASVRHNGPQAVTGMLLYADGSFMQILEGSPAAIDETMGRIRNDDRHRDVVVIETRPIARREFGRWSMGFRRLGEREMRHPNFIPFFEFGRTPAATAAGSGAALALLHKFAASNG
jgi:hypothetical protein